MCETNIGLQQINNRFRFSRFFKNDVKYRWRKIYSYLFSFNIIFEQKNMIILQKQGSTLIFILFEKLMCFEAYISNLKTVFDPKFRFRNIRPNNWKTLHEFHCINFHSLLLFFIVHLVFIIIHLCKFFAILVQKYYKKIERLGT